MAVGTVAGKAAGLADALAALVRIGQHLSPAFIEQLFDKVTHASQDINTRKPEPPVDIIKVRGLYPDLLAVESLVSSLRKVLATPSKHKDAQVKVVKLSQMMAPDGFTLFKFHAKALCRTPDRNSLEKALKA